MGMKEGCKNKYSYKDTVKEKEDGEKHEERLELKEKKWRGE